MLRCMCSTGACVHGHRGGSATLTTAQLRPLSQDTDHEDELREAFKVVRRVLQAVTHCTCNSLMLRCFKTACAGGCVLHMRLNNLLATTMRQSVAFCSSIKTVTVSSLPLR